MIAKKYITNIFQKKLVNIRQQNIRYFNNPDAINKMLTNIKTVNDESYKLIKDSIKSIPKVQLFRGNLFTKSCFVVSRYQLFGYCIASSAYTLYIIYTKWSEIQAIEAKLLTKKRKKEIEKKKIKLLIGTIVLISSSLFGIYITRYMGKRIVKSIYYLPQENKFQINYFSLLCLDKPVYVDPSFIKRIEKPRRFDSTILFEITDPKVKDSHQFISSKGTGLWINKSLFEYIIDNPNEIMHKS